MKRKLAIVVFCGITFCLGAFMPFSKKEPAAVSKRGYLTMKVDGVQKKYDSCWTRAFQQNAATQIYYQLNILSGVPGDYADVSVNDIAPIKNGTYTSAINPVTKGPMAMLGGYRETGSSDIYISYQAGWPLFGISITFSEFNSEYVSGTFQGKLRLVGGTKILNVTEGEFKAYNH
jgi:hypothetical protein